MKRKSDTFTTFKRFKAFIELQTGHKIKCLRSDGGGVYTSNAFRDYLADSGIQYHVTAPHTPQQNGVAERINQSLANSVRTQLVESGLPWSLWAEAAGYFCYTKNLSPHRAINDVPARLLSGQTPSVAHLRPFGCRAWQYVADAKDRRVKLAPCGLPHIFVGYDTHAKAYRLYDPLKRSVVLSRDVQFFEDVFPASGDFVDRDPGELEIVGFPGAGLQPGGTLMTLSCLLALLRTPTTRCRSLTRPQLLL